MRHRAGSWFDPQLVDAFERVAESGAFWSMLHSEHIGAAVAALEPAARIITTADIFDAITADRPYRGPVPIPKALDIMAETVGTVIDAQCFEAMKAALARLPELNAVVPLAA